MTTMSVTSLLRLAKAIEFTRQSLAAKAQPRNEVDAATALSRKIGNLFDDVADDVLRLLSDHGRVPSSDLSRKQVEQLIMRRARELGETMADDALEAANRGRRKAIAELMNKGVTGLSFDDIPDGFADQIRREVFTASESTMSRVAGNVMGRLGDAYEQGLGIDDAAELMRDQFDGLKDWEAKRIARTELQGFQNEGAHATIQERGIDHKEWVSADDDRVRESHLDVHGEITRTGDRFSNGLLHPLDRTGPEEEWINCRCREVPFIMPPDKKAPGFTPFREGDLEDRT